MENAEKLSIYGKSWNLKKIMMWKNLGICCICLNSVSSQCAHGKLFIALEPEVHSKMF